MTIEKDRIVHVYPTWEDHSVDTDDPCWCEPEREVVQGIDGKYGLVLIHRQLH